MEILQEWFALIKASDIQLFRAGKTTITLWGMLWLITLIALLFFVSGLIRRWVARRLLARSRLDIGTREAIGSITRYLVLVIGFLVIMQTAGINLTTFNVLAGAIGVGVGFGLQNIMSNFISGLIIMFERPIKVGDHIDVAGVEGDVVEIGARHTSLITSNGITIIVPNSKFITENVRNWEYQHAQTPLSIAISVAPDSNPRQVEKLLLEVAHKHPDVSKTPASRVYVKALGSKALAFELIVWNRLDVERRHQLVNDLYFNLYDELAAQNIKLGG